jgi:NADPH:quinone reductase-like Zn-dependent oxidoreductase
MLKRLSLTLMRSLRSPISWRFQSLAAGLRRGHDLQCPPPQRRCRGDVVTILGIGGLGLSYLGVQFANSLGFRTVTITRHRLGGALLKLGAHYFIDRATDDVTEAFKHSGGVQPR